VRDVVSITTVVVVTGSGVVSVGAVVGSVPTVVGSVPTVVGSVAIVVSVHESYGGSVGPDTQPSHSSIKSQVES